MVMKPSVGKCLFVSHAHIVSSVSKLLLPSDLAHYLLQNYGRNPRVTKLVNNTEIYLMPSMNPDGYEISNPGCSTFGGLGGLFGFTGRSGRNNGNNVDLNRDFPKQFDERQDVDTRTLERGRQPETKFVDLDFTDVISRC